MPRWNNSNCGFQKGHTVNVGRKASTATKQRMSIAQSGEKSGVWVDNPSEVSYAAIHMWIRKAFGRASICENKKCKYPRKSRRGVKLELPKEFNWALRRGMKYERKRENFVSLCRSCHGLYDSPNYLNYEFEILPI